MIVRILLVGLLLPTLVWAQVSEVGPAKSADNPLTLGRDPVNFSSKEGDFRITFPSGCGKMVTRIPSEELPDVDGIPAVLITTTFCDRYQEKGEGCSVSSHFNVTSADGGYPESEQVIERVVRALEGMKAAIKKQTHLRKELPDGTIIEGLDVLAADSAGVGQVWVRGLLYEGDIFIISAWKNTGGLWDDPAYLTFFNSFQPGAK